MSILSRFRIEALHGANTIDLEIKDDRLIIVGENGTGKSTVLKLIHYFLTNQWSRMLDFDFGSLSVVVHSEEVVLTRDEIVKNSKLVHGRHKYSESVYERLPRRVLFELDEMTRQGSLFGNLNTDYIRHLANRFRVPSSMLFSYFQDYIEVEGEDPEYIAKLKHVNQVLDIVDIGQILYLPTYRRIEQDLDLVFPNAEKQIRRNRERHPAEAPSYIELVEFGMEDVENTINTTMNTIKDKVRDDLNALTGVYLGDIIRGEHRSENLLPQLNATNPATIEAIFNRIPSTVLSSQDQQTLRGILLSIDTEQKVSENNKVVAHFLTQLIDLHNRQTEREKNIRDFVQVCNKYLIGKSLHYNDTAFQISIDRELSRREAQTISMKTLSSGEKQIVSLFSHIYLSGGSRYFVVIDEPELSLSVPWQTQFLPDILDSNRCSGLLAVTHSPFIFDNALDIYAHSLEEFTNFV